MVFCTQLRVGIVPVPGRTASSCDWHRASAAFARAASALAFPSSASLLSFDSTNAGSANPSARVRRTCPFCATASFSMRFMRSTIKSPCSANAHAHMWELVTSTKGGLTRKLAF
eukprot:1121687-Prorocentrum_minimum.AAC.2